MRSITNCNALLTTPCAASVTAAVGTGINGPANGIVFNSQYVYAGADAYGNVYQLNGTGGSIAVPGYYENVGYAGGAPLTSLLTAEVPTLSSVYSATETAYPAPAPTQRRRMSCRSPMATYTSISATRRSTALCLRGS